MADNPAITSDPQPRKPVPFVGWSRAAARFREMAAMHAPEGKVPVLLLGPAGTGKRTMAQVWQHCAGLNKTRLPIVNLDDDNAVIPPLCIAFSTGQLPNSVHVQHLDCGDYGVLPVANANSKAVHEDLANRFPLRFYMPSLRTRPADLLALLHFFNRHVLPRGELKCSYARISQTLLYNLLKTSWNANALDLLNFLTVSASEDLHGLGSLNEECSPIDLGTLRSKNALGVGTAPMPQPDQMTLVSAVQAEIDRGDLPDTQLWREYGTGPRQSNPWLNAATTFMKSLSTKFDRNLDKGKPIRFDDLDALAVRLYCDIGFSLLAPSSLDRIQLNPSAEAFRTLTIEQFVDSGMKGIDSRGGKRTSASASDLARGCEFLKRKAVFGTTFTALQEGLAVDLEEAATLIAPRSANVNEPEEIATTTANKDQETTGSNSDVWPELNKVPIPKIPPFFEDRPLVGQKLQIARALKEAGVLTKGSTKELNSEAPKETAICGRQKGRTTFYVYLAKSETEKRLTDALSALERITSDCYRPWRHRLQKRFMKFEKEYLESTSEDNLAKALNAVGILTTDMVVELHEMLRLPGRLLGKKLVSTSKTIFRIHLSDHYDEESQVKKAKTLVAEIQAHSTSSTSETL